MRPTPLDPRARPTSPARAPIGLGYRRPLHDALLAAPEGLVDFVELAPENYLVEHDGALVPMGGERRRRLHAIQARYPILTHGLALSLGGEDALDEALLAGIAGLQPTLGSPHHSDHLCWSSAHGAHLHELLPLPFTPASARHVAARVAQARAALAQPFAVENVSAYLRHADDVWREAEWVTEVVDRADAYLLLDVNNVLVNALNFGTDPVDELLRFPLERVLQIHVAGYRRDAPDLVVDTHGAAMDPRVLDLLAIALPRTGPVPILLERDNEIPPFEQLAPELEALRAVAERALVPASARGAHADVYP
jgi:uncharacterized protein (UPF0276 family)